MVGYFLYTVVVAQLVRASDCGSEGRGFEPLLSPKLLSGGNGRRSQLKGRRLWEPSRSSWEPL